jgi:hypothetical protein
MTHIGSFARFPFCVGIHSSQMPVSLSYKSASPTSVQLIVNIKNQNSKKRPDSHPGALLFILIDAVLLYYYLAYCLFASGLYLYKVNALSLTCKVYFCTEISRHVAVVVGSNGLPGYIGNRNNSIA